MDFIDIARERRSVRTFEDRPVEHKAAHRDEQFPQDLDDARAMGERLVRAAEQE